MRISDYSGLARWIDPTRHPSHRTILTIAVGATIAAVGVDSQDLVGALLTGAGAVTTWALAREVDPDRPQSAAVAAVLAAIVALVAGPPAVAPVFIATVAARMVSRSTGLVPRWTDLAVNAVIAFLFAGTPWGWAAGIVFAFAIVRDAGLPGDTTPGALLFAGATAVGVTTRVALAGSLGTWVAPAGIELVVLVLGIMGWVPLVRRTEPILSVGDWSTVPLDPRRVREARLFGIAPALVAVAAAGSAGVVALAPLWVTAVTVAVVRRGLADRSDVT